MASSKVFAVAFCLALSCVIFVNPSTARAASEEDLLLQQDRQKQIQAETDSMVRRLGTMLRVLEYYQIDKAGERKMMEEMTGALSGLSKKQMAEVIRRLESAAKSQDDKKTNEEVQQVYARHREILDTLKSLMSRHDAVRTLDQAADRLDDMAKKQLEHYFQTTQLIRDSLDQANPNLSPTQRLLLNKRHNFNLEPRRQGDAQIEIHQDVERIIRKVLDLRPQLPEEQKERVQRMSKRAAEQRLLDNLNSASNQLKGSGPPAQRYDSWKDVNAKQWQAAGQIKELARVLRVSSELLAVLHEARDRVDLAIVKQDEINKETKDTQAKDPATKEPDPKTAMDKAGQDAKAAEKILELSKEQARVQYDTKDTADLVKPHVADLAKKIEKAEKTMKDARAALAKNQPKEAADPQDKAAQTLEEVRKDLDKLIAATEKAKDDPLAALQKAADDLAKVIADQTDTRDKTQKNVGDKEKKKVADLAKNQKELANRTEQLKDAPLPAEEFKNSLDKVDKAMLEAAKALKNQKAEKALPKQDAALKALKEAQKEIGEKIAELAQRKDDIAKLEEAAKKLEQLAKAEKGISEKAKEMRPDAAKAQDLAKDQEKLTPEAKKVAKNIEALAPEASQKVNESTEKMAAAKKDLDNNQTDPAANEAKQAANKLEDAQKAIAKALGEKKAQNIADQAALQPNKVAPLAAAQLIAKALEQTEKAEDQAKQSAEPFSGKPQATKPDLARLQENIAKQADKMKLVDAAKDASKAAKALKEGDIQKALENQQNALEKIQDAAQKPGAAEAAEPSPAEAKEGPMPGEAKGSESKNGDPKAAETKDNQVQPGSNKEKGNPGEPKEAKMKAAEAKTGQTKAGQKSSEAKGNEVKAAEAKSAQPKAGAPKDEKTAQAKSSESKEGEAKAGQAKNAAAKAGDAKAGQPQAKAAPMNEGNDSKAGEAKDSQAKAGQAKSGEAMQGEAKMAKAHPGAGKMGEGIQGMAKGGEADMGDGNKGQPEEAQAKAIAGSPLPQAKNAPELAQAQKEVMEATKALAQSQDATQAAMAALGQAQAQAPMAVQKQLQNAAKQLAKADQNLQKGQPTQAGEKQNLAAKNLADALKTMNAALQAMNQPQVQPGEMASAQAQAGQPMEQGQEGMGEEGQKEGKEGQGKEPGRGQGKEKGPSQEKNEAKGKGDRVADGKIGNAKSQLLNASGDGSFLHLPPRQRELIRQALSGQLPPEYAAMIQQYYINIARGRAATNR